MDELTIKEIKERLDNLGVPFNDRAKKQELLDLLNQHEKSQENFVLEDEVADSAHEELEKEVIPKSTSVVDKIKGAIKLPEEATPQKETPLVYKVKEHEKTTSKPLTNPQLILLAKAGMDSAEYQSVENGIDVRISDRATTGYRVVDIAGKQRARLLVDKVYTMSEEDYKVAKNETMQVKTKDTVNLCCGRARWEHISVLEEV
ncbi:hypothetical protein BG262_02825 [Floricoccus penangensis]|uniref:Uncharacterized protein n=1 Tax=Floricoccus penangensis TaxID=1859475 RepID=A0A9Q5NZM4_9LACT|nr:hypothetical protein [Floricoccus penangensis]OFI46748.1 hypothetical protein BG262_02825 [Floricoccus penangensis]